MLVWYQCLTSVPVPVYINKWHKCPCIAVNHIMWLRAWAQSVVINVCFFTRHSWPSGDKADGERSERLHWLRQLQLPAKTNSRITCFSEQDSYKRVLRECLDPSPRWLSVSNWDGMKEGEYWGKGGEGGVGLILLLFFSSYRSLEVREMQTL